MIFTNGSVNVSVGIIIIQILEASKNFLEKLLNYVNLKRTIHLYNHFLYCT